MRSEITIPTIENGAATGDWVGNNGKLSACADFISDVIVKKDRDIEIHNSKCCSVVSIG